MQLLLEKKQVLYFSRIHITMNEIKPQTDSNCQLNWRCLATITFHMLKGLTAWFALFVLLVVKRGSNQKNVTVCKHPFIKQHWNKRICPKPRSQHLQMAESQRSSQAEA